MLDQYLSPCCTINVKTLHNKLHKMWKIATLAMKDYLITMKTTMDSLLVAGSQIPDDDVIAFVMDDLDSTYKNFISMAQLVPFKQLEWKLLILLW